MLPDLLETLCTADLKTFKKNEIYRKESERLLYRYIDKFLKAPYEQKKKLKELIFSCLEPYKTFADMEKDAMRVSNKLTPKLVEKRLRKETNLERLN